MFTLDPHILDPGKHPSKRMEKCEDQRIFRRNLTRCTDCKCVKIPMQVVRETSKLKSKTNGASRD